ncbi:hypothetical protein N8J89_35690 [Crossiella sp. CA-258035]|uniref:hypothetical protein n=1 Tax=Crossiella sp. CA-258035 TaxID=2981138 RepID=UPI0024BC71E2|nr:hypothetical protein [Crossiella sp. CA-258035]WHT18401.1 hypothetical protein N8J89_35690 [Crossiella sp. CA-258035]
MAPHELTAADWPALDVPAARRVAEGLARRHGIGLREVFRYTYAGRGAPVAVFDVAGRDFALVPGGAVPLGFDERGWTPSEEEMASFLGDEDALSPAAEPVRSTPYEPEFAAEDLTEIRAGLARWTTRPRVVELPSLLVAVQAEPVGERGPAEVAAALAAAGQRLPEPDEWEHAAASGARTLFPWGDRFPSSANTIDPSVPNLFGLRIAHHPDEPELTADPAVVLGACPPEDGPWFETRLAHAPSYRGALPGDRPVFVRAVLPVTLSTVD